MRISRSACIGAMLVAALFVSGAGPHAKVPPPGQRAAEPWPWKPDAVASPPWKPDAVAAQPWKPKLRVAAAFARRRGGRIGFAVRTPTRAWHWRADRQFPSASVIKAMLMVAYLNRPGVRVRPFDRSERDLLSRMIRRSENWPASTLMRIVGVDGLQRLARRAGMEQFVPVLGFWGTSRITAKDQARFLQRIDHLVPRRHRDYAMRLLETIVPRQRWGIAQARPSGWRLYFKGGWGAGASGVENQVALLMRGHQRVSIVMLTQNNGSHEYAKRTLRGIAKRLLRGLPRRVEVP